MSDRIKRIVFNPIGWIIGGLIGIIVAYYIVSLQMPIKVLKEGDNPKIAFSGEPYQICRNVEYLRDATIVIDRALLKNLDNGDTININLASVTIAREKGKYQVCRLILLLRREHSSDIRIPVMKSNSMIAASRSVCIC